MQNKINKNQSGKAVLIIIIIAILIIAAAAIYYFIFNQPDAEQPISYTTETTNSLGTQLFEENSNPVQDNLQTNNPLKNTNPFENSYKNPFE